MKRRLLFLTYYWPPSGGPGVQRALKWARYLPEFGWQPTVLTVDPEHAAYPNLDPSLAADVDVALPVVRSKAWDPYALYAGLQGKAKRDTVSVSFLGESETTWQQKLGRWIRANLFLPDARVGWVPFAVREGRRLLSGGAFEAIVTTGPPQSTHLSGYLLAKQSGLPWVADLRDPWTGSDFYHLLPMSPPACRLDAALERAVLKSASAVTVVSHSMRHGLRTRVDRAYDVIENGFDPTDFAAAPPPLAPTFDITYVGNLNDARNPEALWRALASMDGASDLRVRLVGNVDPVVMERARAHGVADRVALEPYQPHAEAVRLMRSAPLLLLVINQVPGAEWITTGKLYEYVASGRPILGIGPPEGDAARILADAEAGAMFDYDDAAGVAAFVRQHYEAWTEGQSKAGASPQQAAPYSRRSQAGQLAALLDGLLASNSAS